MYHIGMENFLVFLFFLAGAVFFISVGRLLFGVKSFSELLDDFENEKVNGAFKNLFFASLKFRFIRSYWRSLLGIFGDKFVTSILKIFGVILLIMSVLAVVFAFFMLFAFHTI